MASVTDGPTFDIFDVFADLVLGKRFSVIYDPGDGEVISFQGCAREKNDARLTINYTYQYEWTYGHDVCYGVIQLDLSLRSATRYSLRDKYDDCFEPSANFMLERFKNRNPADIRYEVWNDGSDPHNEYYDQAEWMDLEDPDGREDWDGWEEQTECNDFMGG